VVINSEGGIVTNGASLLTVADNSSIINDGRITIFDGTIEVVSSVSSIINNNSLSNRGVINIFSGSFENKQDTTNPNLVVVNNTGVINATRGKLLIEVILETIIRAL